MAKPTKVEFIIGFLLAAPLLFLHGLFMFHPIRSILALRIVWKKGIKRAGQPEKTDEK